MICFLKVKEEKEDSPEVEDEEMLDDPDEDYAISEEEEVTSDDGEEDIDGPFASLSQLADISLAAEGKLKDLALSEQIRCVTLEYLHDSVHIGFGDKNKSVTLTLSTFLGRLERGNRLWQRRRPSCQRRQPRLKAPR